MRSFCGTLVSSAFMRAGTATACPDWHRGRLFSCDSSPSRHLHPTTALADELEKAVRLV